MTLEEKTKSRFKPRYVLDAVCFATGFSFGVLDADLNQSNNYENLRMIPTIVLGVLDGARKLNGADDDRVKNLDRYFDSSTIEKILDERLSKDYSAALEGLFVGTLRGSAETFIGYYAGLTAGKIMNCFR